MLARRFVLVVSLVLAGVAFAAPGAGASPLRLDRSFGDGGVVYPEFRTPDAPFRSIGPMLGAGDGGAFVLETVHATPCVEGCKDWFLTRYKADGRPDHGFGLATVAQEQEYSSPLISVDSQGRPVLAWLEGRRIVIRRFQKTGRPDPTFGRDSTLTLSCGGCEPQILAIGAGDRVILSSEPRNRPRRIKGSVPIVTRLQSSGKPDRSFGGDGTIRPRLRGRFGPSTIDTAPSGAIVFSGSVCCGAEKLPYVSRIAANGKVDRRFEAAATQAIKRLRAWTKEYLWWRSDLLAHPDGRVTLLTNIEGRGVFLRLRRSGRLDRSFGRNGGWQLPWVVADGVLDARGGITLIAETEQRDNVGYSLRPNGRLDRDSAVPLPGSDAWESIVTEPQPGGRVLVFDRDAHECRGDCPSEPRIYRLTVQVKPSGHRRGG